jgi:hypothetical protein
MGQGERSSSTKLAHRKGTDNNAVSCLSKGTRSVSSRGHKRAFVAAREQSRIRADTAIRRGKGKERIIVVAIWALSARPALVCLTASVFDRGGIGMDGAIQKVTRGALEYSANWSPVL